MIFVIQKIFRLLQNPYHRPWVKLRLVLKPLPLILLAMWAKEKLSTWALYGLMFSTAGDILLVPMHKITAFFGVLSFTVGTFQNYLKFFFQIFLTLQKAQIFYIINFNAFELNFITSLAITVWSMLVYKFIGVQLSTKVSLWFRIIIFIYS